MTLQFYMLPIMVIFQSWPNLRRYKRSGRIIFDEALRNPAGKIEKLEMWQKYVK